MSLGTNMKDESKYLHDLSRMATERKESSKSLLTKDEHGRWYAHWNCLPQFMVEKDLAPLKEPPKKPYLELQYLLLKKTSTVDITKVKDLILRFR